MLMFQLPHVPEWFLSHNDWANLRKTFAHTRLLRQNVSPEDFAVIVRPRVSRARCRRWSTYYRAVLRARSAQARRAVSPSRPETLLIWGRQDVALGKKADGRLGQMVPRLRVGICQPDTMLLGNPEAVSRLLVDALSKPIRAALGGSGRASDET